MRMRWISLVVLVAPSLIGCEKSPRDKLQGEWDGVSLENCPPAELQRATAWAKGMAITFTGNKVRVMIPAESPQSGTFKIARAEKDDLLLTFVRDDGGHYAEAEMKLVSDHELHWNIGDGRTVVMTKKM